jgi:membrane associated rhomboid family serine protease
MPQFRTIYILNVRLLQFHVSTASLTRNSAFNHMESGIRHEDVSHLLMNCIHFIYFVVFKKRKFEALRRG